MSVKLIFIFVTFFLISSVIVIVSTNKILLAVSSGIILSILVFTCIFRFWVIFKPSRTLDFYKFALNRMDLSTLALDEGIKNLPVEKLSDNQLQKRNSSLNSIVLFNRIFLLTAQKMKEYKNSKLNVAFYCFTAMILLFINVITFALVNFAIFKIDQSNFNFIGNQSFFSFFYYSFNNTLFNSLDNLVPNAFLSQTLFMIQSTIVLVIITLLVALFFSVKSEKFNEEIDKIISGFTNHGQYLESLLIEDFKMSTIDEALIELENIKSFFIKFLYYISNKINE